MTADLSHRFKYHPPGSENIKAAHEVARGKVGILATYFSETLPPGREQALAITKLEEALFWANAAIARGQS